MSPTLLALLALATAPEVGGPPAPVAEADATDPCRTQALALLTIDRVEAPTVPVIDDWQVFWNGVPLSDHQVATMSGDARLIERTTSEMNLRDIWVFIGMSAAALGTAVSCVGWVLLGQSDSKDISLGVTLPLALGGLAVGGGGVLLTSNALQAPLEPHLAPTPTHRLSRDEARRVVSAINRRIIERCRDPAAAEALAAQR